MNRDRLSIFEEFRSHVEGKVLEDIAELLGTEDAVSECEVGVDEKECIKVHMTLKKFSFLSAKEVFLHLSEFMRRSYYNVYTSEETDMGVRYLYFTGREGWDGIKMEVCFEPVSNEEAG